MKIKTSGRRLACVMLVALAICGGAFFFARSEQKAYAATNVTTFDEFNAYLGEAREKLQELEAELEHLRALGDYGEYQDLWDTIEDYASTWRRGEIISKGPLRQIAGTFYDANLYGEVVAKVRAIEPEFQPAENILMKDPTQDNTEVPSYNLAGSFLSINNPTVATVGHTMLYLAHIRSALDYAPTYFGEFATETSLAAAYVSAYQAYALSGGTKDTFMSGYNKYIQMAALYNRTRERNQFSDVHEVLMVEHLADYKKLSESMLLLEHGENLASTRYFPGAIYGPSTFPITVKNGIGKSEYTLQELVKYLPNCARWKEGADKDAIIAQFQYVLEDELRIARTALGNIDPALADLGSKSFEEIVRLGRNALSIFSVGAVKQQASNASAEVEALANLIATFDNEMLVIDEHPGDKYFQAVSSSAVGWGVIIPHTESIATFSLTDTAHHISAQEIVDSGMDEATLWDYYGRLGLAALEFDKTATRNLLQHETWPVIEYDDNDENNENSDGSNSSSSQTSNPAAPSASGSSSTATNGSTAPNTGVASFIATGAGTTIGIAAIASIAIATGVIVYRKRTRQS